MKIIRRLQLLNISSVMVMLFVVATLIWSWHLFSLALERQAYAKKIESQLNLLQIAVLKNQFQVGENQLLADHSVALSFAITFSKLLVLVPDLTSSQQILQNSIVTQEKSIEQLYLQLNQIKDNKPIKAHLQSRLLLQIELIREDSLQLAAIAEADINTTLQQQFAIILIVMISGVSFLMVSSHSVTRLLKSSIDELQSGIEKLRKGQYKQIKLSHASNEFNEFVEKFNEMSAELNRTTVTRDVLQQIVNERTKVLEQLAGTDPLTQIANRRVLYERGLVEFSRARRHKEKLTLMMLDCDYFKQINDVHGHQIGDNALIHLCRVCEKEIRNVDFFARFGGEEFVIILPNCNAIGGIDKARRIKLALAEKSLYKKSERIDLTVSIGIAEINSEHKKFEDLLNDADKALLIAKSNGRNRYEIA